MHAGAVRTRQMRCLRTEPPGVSRRNFAVGPQRMDELQRARFKLDLENERLLDGAAPAHLTRKAFDLLRFLVQNPTRLLTRDEILENIWRGIHVSEGLVREYVHDLRLALDDDPRNPRLIETVRGRGYRFLGGIEIVAPAPSVGRPHGHGADPPTILVEPIENLAGGERWERFCRGMRDDLITELSRYPDCAVVAGGASLTDHAAKGDLRDVGTDYLLRGSMQASERMLRMNLHLIETPHCRTIWSERYERDIVDIFTIQQNIVGHVVSALAGLEGQIADAERRRLGRKPPEDLNAYGLYLLALGLEERHQRESTLDAFALLQQALSLDPELARAWLVLGWACHQIWSELWTDDPQFYATTELEAYVKAARLDPRDPLALAEEAAVRAIDGDLDRAKDRLERAVDLGWNQSDALATAAKYFAMVIDEPVRAVRLFERSQELCTSEADLHFMHWARVAYFARDYEQALNATRRAPDLKTVRLFEILSAVQLGRANDVCRLRAAFVERYPDFDLAEFMQGQPILGTRATAHFLDGITKAGLG
jgi:TolB-like protein